MGNTKVWYQSKTIIGSLLTFVMVVLSLFGYVVTDQAAFIAHYTDSIIMLGATFSTLLTIYGRMKADTKLIVKK